jgi:hypothetical protein
MGYERLCKDLKRKIHCWCFIGALLSVYSVRYNKSCGCIVPFQNQLPTEKLVSPHIRRVNKFREYPEVWFLNSDGGVGSRAGFQHEKIPQKRLGARKKCAFTIGSLEV